MVRSTLLFPHLESNKRFFDHDVPLGVHSPFREFHATNTSPTLFSFSPLNKTLSACRPAVEWKRCFFDLLRGMGTILLFFPLPLPKKRVPIKLPDKPFPLCPLRAAMKADSPFHKRESMTFPSRSTTSFSSATCTAATHSEETSFVLLFSFSIYFTPNSVVFF